MRHLLLFAALIAVVALPLVAEEKKMKEPGLADLAWLVGDWEGTTGDKQFDEHWIPAKGGLMLGVGRWVKDGRAIDFEYMRIFQAPEGLTFVAQPRGNLGTAFRATKVEEKEVVFENPENDFPKIIRYALTDADTLEARISNTTDGKSRAMTFVMKRK